MSRKPTHKFFSHVERCFPSMSETDRLLEVIRGRNAKTVGLQFPVGLRTKAVELAQEIERDSGMRLNEIFSLSGPAAYRR